MAKASRIIAIDINADKFELARQMGATDTVNPKRSQTRQFKRSSSNSPNGGVDYSFECVGSTSS